MDTNAMRLFWSALLGLIATAPFVLMEAVYTSGFERGVPLALFTALWLLASAFLLLAISALRARYDAPARTWIGPLALKLFAALPLFLAWVHLVNDQMPCLLGGRGC